MYRPFGPRFSLPAVTTRSRAWLLTAGASRLVCLPNRSKHRVPDHFETSLEEAAVSRPGRAGASRLVCLPNRSKHKAPNHFETSLEEAAVSRPGRKAGMKNGQPFERRRCGTSVTREYAMTTISYRFGDPPDGFQSKRRASRRHVRETRLTAGPTHCRLFEASLEMVGNLVLRSVGRANQARSAGS